MTGGVRCGMKVLNEKPTNHIIISVARELKDIIDDKIIQYSTISNTITLCSFHFIIAIMG